MQGPGKGGRGENIHISNCDQSWYFDLRQSGNRVVVDARIQLPFKPIAGLGIAFHAKATIHNQAPYAIATSGLDSILYLMGMRDRELLEA